MNENKFQSELKKDILKIFPEAIVLKNDPVGYSGIPDLTILYKNHWAMLECKKDSKSKKQPNQDYFIEKANSMSYARFINPENKEEILNELQQAWRT
jgi:hypothetical protein